MVIGNRVAVVKIVLEELFLVTHKLCHRLE